MFEVKIYSNIAGRTFNILWHRHSLIVINVLLWVVCISPILNSASAQIGLPTQNNRQEEIAKDSVPKVANVRLWSKERALEPEVLDRYVKIFASRNIIIKPKKISQNPPVADLANQSQKPIEEGHHEDGNEEISPLNADIGSIVEGEEATVLSLVEAPSGFGDNVKIASFDDVKFPNLEEIRANIGDNNFLAEEEKLNINILTLQDEEQAKAQMDLIHLYLAYDYIPEALSLAQKANQDGMLEAEDEAISSLIKFMQYAIGRYKDSLEGDEIHSNFEINLAAMAHAKLGHYDAAYSLFVDTPLEISLPRSYQAEFYVLKGVTALQKQNANLAHNAFVALVDYEDVADVHTKRVFWNELQSIKNGLANDSLTTEQGVADLTHLSRFELPYKNIALLEKIKLETNADLTSHEDALADVQNLSLQWSGGYLERELKLTKANLYKASGDIEKAFDVYRDIISTYKNADIVVNAEASLQVLFATLFEQKENTDLLKTTQLFYENIDLLQPGEEGDGQIRHLTQRLVTLDLLSEATELLEHQVFQRLRGADRANVAVDLATIYLDNLEPLEALRVIRSTRITGLDDGVISNRRYVEVRALWRSGQHGKALARLETNQGDQLNKKTRLLKAEILLSMGDYKNAAFIMAPEAIALLSSENHSYTKQDEVFILQTIAALIQLRDHEAVQTIQNLAKGQLDDRGIGQIISAFAPEEPPETFLLAYQKWLAENVSGISKS